MTVSTRADGSDTIATTAARVLIADDDVELRDAMRALLEEQGFLIVGEAADGAEAVTKAADLEPDVVLMDLRMPGVDGIQATFRIKARLPLVQVVMLTAYEDPGLSRGAEEAGVYAYLVKGCPAGLICDVLNSARSFRAGLIARQEEGWGPPGAHPRAIPAS
jgi:DNA-binding NarL/FixJ family response regulator